MLSRIPPFPSPSFRVSLDAALANRASCLPASYSSCHFARSRSIEEGESGAVSSTRKATSPFLHFHTARFYLYTDNAFTNPLRSQSDEGPHRLS